MIPETMLGVHFLGEGAVSVGEMPVPEPHDQMVLVRVQAAAICGTDRELLEGEGQSLVPGHENAGEVVAVDKAARLKPGDRVAINCHITCKHCQHCVRGDLYFCPELQVVGFDIDGGFAEYVLVPEASCMVLPDDISFEAGSLMMDVLGTAYRGVSRAHPRPHDKVAVWGAGPIGLEAAISAMWLGCEVAVLDMNAYRLKMAQDLGVGLVLNPGEDDVTQALMDWTGGDGLDIAYQCTGSERAALQALGVLKPRGTLGVIGVSHHLAINPWEHLICQELTIYGSRNFRLPQFDEMVAMIRHGAPVDSVVTHRFPIAEAEAAFSLFKSAECGKIVFTG
jgi:threonine dehydrogenase-like Zn-dependent dehydrogenase